MFDLQEICWAPWNSHQASVPMVEDGFTCIDVPQGYKSLNEPTKKILELVVRAGLHHGNHPVLRWQAGCVCTMTDGRSNLMFTKPDLNTSASRVDGMSAIADAFFRCIVPEEEKTISYTGLRSVG